MALKVLLIGALVAVASAVPVEYQTGLAHKDADYEHESPAHYDFNYSVHDEHTGDIKSHQESRKGDDVHGRYELIDSDGYRRIVEYTVNEHSGFNAVVHREPTDIKIPVPVHQVHSPVTYSSPVGKVATPVLVNSIADGSHTNYPGAHVSFSDPLLNYKH